MELWDVSGNRELYEGTWPAIMHGAVGVVYVYDATKVGEEKDLDQWWEPPASRHLRGVCSAPAATTMHRQGLTSARLLAPCDPPPPPARNFCARAGIGPLGKVWG